MKIALCLHGLFDSLYDSTSKGMDGYIYIKKHILDIYNPDVFVHSWEVNKSQEIIDLYKPKANIFEEQIDFSKIIKERGLDKLQNCPRPPFIVLSHFYSVNKTIKLAFDSDNYDIIIKSRFDLGRINRQTSGPGLNNPYPVQCINFYTDIDEDKLYLANWNHFAMGPADMWFYGSGEIMKNFITLYDDLLKNFYINSEYHKFATSIEGNSGDLSNSIAFYKYWMIQNGLWNNLKKLDTKWE
jgi:hypothetical protein